MCYMVLAGTLHGCNSSEIFDLKVFVIQGPHRPDLSTLAMALGPVTEIQRGFAMLPWVSISSSARNKAEDMGY